MLQLQAPAWLPYKLRQPWDNARINWAIKAIDQSRPRSAAPAENADAEVHMLLCHRDVKIAVVALKSLLRFDEAHFAVTLTNDGSLTEDDRLWVDQHVPGCRWLPRHAREPQLKNFFHNHPVLAKSYQEGHPFWCKLLHPALLARSERVIVYDADTAFFRLPQRLLLWARGGEANAWYLHDHQDESVQVPELTREAFRHFAAQFTPAGRRWQMDYYFFNAGLLAYRPVQLCLDLAERYEAWRATAPSQYLTGKPGLWFGAWTPEQTAYQIMFAVMDPPAQPLGNDYHLGGDSGHVFNHFLRYYLVQKRSLRMLRDLVATF